MHIWKGFREEVIIDFDLEGGRGIHQTAFSSVLLAKCCSLLGTMGKNKRGGIVVLALKRMHSLVGERAWH